MYRAGKRFRRLRRAWRVRSIHPHCSRHRGLWLVRSLRASRDELLYRRSTRHFCSGIGRKCSKVFLCKVGSCLDLGQVGGRVVGGPAALGPEGLGLRRLRAPRDAEPVLVGVEGSYPVVADPEPLPAYGGVDMLGRKAQNSGVCVDRRLALL